MLKRGAPALLRAAQERDEVFEQLIVVNRKAFDLKRFNTCYHALNAALHWASEDDNDQQIILVKSLAESQLGWIDRNAPSYQHSTYQAGLRGHASIFVNLVRQAEAALLKIRSRRQFGELLRAWPGNEKQAEG